MRVLLKRVYDEALCYQEIAGTSEETDALPTNGLVTGSRFLCVDTGHIYLFNDKDKNWNGPFKLYESIEEST